MAETKMVHAIETTNLADILERVLDKRSSYCWRYKDSNC